MAEEVKGIPETQKNGTLDTLKVAADRIAQLLCELSSDRTLFVSEAGQSPQRKVDTKSLKEFSGVLKEMSAVVGELGEGANTDGCVRIEFSDEAAELGE